MTEDFVPAYEPMACPEWEERLNKFHPDDLTPDEWEAMQRHLERCEKCAFVRWAYRDMGKKLREFFGLEENPWLRER